MRHHRNRAGLGFTLIELLIVVAVIGIIAAIAIPNLLNAINKARQKRTMGELRAIGSGLAMYQRDNAFYPVMADAVAEGLKPHLQVYIGVYSTLDGWKTPIAYESNGSEYTLVSYGRNKVPDPPYHVGETGHFDCDILFSEGMFVQWPEGTQN